MYKHTHIAAHPPRAGAASPTALSLLGLVAGTLNGLLGTGGGMVLTLGLRRAFPEDSAENMATSTASVLVFSVLSTILYSIQGHIDLHDTLPILLPALLGGVLGAVLLGRIRRGGLDLILSLMLLYTGLSLLL